MLHTRHYTLHTGVKRGMVELEGGWVKKGMVELEGVNRKGWQSSRGGEGKKGLAEF